MAKRLAIGDIIEIDVGTGFAYAQYTHENELMGSLVRVFETVWPKPQASFDEIARSPPLFLTFYELKYAVKNGLVKVVGKAPLADPAFPLFRTHDMPEPGVRKIPPTAWWLWDGDQEWRVPALTPEQRKYPLRGIANTQLLKERILGGWRSENDPWAGGD